MLIRDKQAKTPNEADKYVGLKLRLLRKEKKLSQRMLASKINITFQQIQKYEKGINRISIGTLYDICSVLKIPPSEFLKDFYGEKKIAEKNLSKNMNKILQEVSSLSGDDQEKVLQFIANLCKTKIIDKEA